MAVRERELMAILSQGANNKHSCILLSSIGRAGCCFECRISDMSVVEAWLDRAAWLPAGVKAG